MIEKILARSKTFFRHLRTKIWFLPSIITVAFFLLGIILLSLQYNSWVQQLGGYLSNYAISKSITARSILSILTGGLISLVVFSFSMVMVVLNQASAQFSPRLLPGLISRRQHQYILGYYLGVILYNLTVLSRIGPDNANLAVPVLSVILAIIFGIVGLGLFIVFINSISSSVRIDEILSNLYDDAQQALVKKQQERADKQQEIEFPDPTDDWYELKSKKTGYLRKIDKASMLALAEEMESSFIVLPAVDAFILTDQLLVKSKKKLTEAQEEAMRDVLFIVMEDDTEDDFLHSINQLTEIAVKAMSPGINDPVTAMQVLNHITALLMAYLNNASPNFLLTKSKKGRIWLGETDFEEIIFSIYAPLRCYCTSDVLVTRKMIRSLQHLATNTNLSAERRGVLANQITQIKKDAEQRMVNAQDIELIQQL